MKLKGKCAIISGASQGLGLEIAKHFVKEGAHIVVCARDESRLQNATRELLKLANGNKVIPIAADVSNSTQVTALVKNAIQSISHIDILVCNAGIYGTKGPIEEIDWDEWSHTIDINLKGSVLLSRAIIPIMKKNQRGKIIFLSGGGATKPLPYLSAYAASKAALVRFSETLAEEVKDFGINVNAVAPGALNTKMLDEIIEAGAKKIGQAYYDQSIKQKATGGTPLTLGAELCVYLASTESDGITGKLISAVWDPWESLASYLDEIKNTDIYTLRRIIPSDRGKTWGEIP